MPKGRGDIAAVVVRNWSPSPACGRGRALGPGRGLLGWRSRHTNSAITRKPSPAAETATSPKGEVTSLAPSFRIPHSEFRIRTVLPASELLKGASRFLDDLRVSDLLADGFGLLEQGSGLLDLAQIRVGDAEVAEFAALALRVTDLSGDD